MMNLRKTALRGVGLLALMTLTAPALAHSRHTTTNTSAEDQTTAQLNQQQLSNPGTTALAQNSEPETANPPGPNSGANDSTNAMSNDTTPSSNATPASTTKGKTRHSSTPASDTAPSTPSDNMSNSSAPSDGSQQPSQDTTSSPH